MSSSTSLGSLMPPDGPHIFTFDHAGHTFRVDYYAVLQDLGGIGDMQTQAQELGPVANVIRRLASEGCDPAQAGVLADVPDHALYRIGIEILRKGAQLGN